MRGHVTLSPRREPQLGALPVIRAAEQAGDPGRLLVQVVYFSPGEAMQCQAEGPHLAPWGTPRTFSLVYMQ